MNSCFWVSTGSPGFEGQSILVTVATQAARNSGGVFSGSGHMGGGGGVGFPGAGGGVVQATRSSEKMRQTRTLACRRRAVLLKRWTRKRKVGILFLQDLFPNNECRKLLLLLYQKLAQSEVCYHEMHRQTTNFLSGMPMTN